MRFLNHYRSKIALFSIFVLLSVLFFGATPAVADELTTENIQPIGQGQEETPDPRAITLGKVWFETTSTIPISYAPYPNISVPTSYSVQPNTGGWILGRTYDCYYIHYDVPNGKALRGYVPISSLNPQTYTWINYDVFLPATCTATTQVISGPGTTNTYYPVGEIYAGEDPLMVLGTEVNPYNNVTYYYVQYQTSSGLIKRGWIDPRLGTVTIQNLSWANLSTEQEYIIMNVSSGKVLHWNTDNTIVQKSLSDRDRQLFKIEKSDVSGYYRILPSRNTSLALSINTNSFHEGLSVIVETKAPVRKGQEIYIEANGYDPATYRAKYGLLTRVTGNFRGVEVYASSSAEGASVIQSLYYGNPNQQWIFIPYIEKQARILYDSSNTYTTSELKNLYMEATNYLFEEFKVDFSVQSVQLASNLTGASCPRTANSIGCSYGCGDYDDCSSLHHKSADKLIAINDSPSIYTCNLVGHAICRLDYKKDHICPNGIGYQNGRSIIVDANTVTKTELAVKTTLLHELSHNLGANHAEDPENDDSTICLPDEQCIFNGDIGAWCSNCYERICVYLYGE